MSLTGRLRRVMADDRERALGELAVRRGLIAPSRLEESLRERETAAGARTLGEILLARGWLTPDQWIDLREVQAREDLAGLSREKHDALPPEVRARLADPSRNLDAYVLVQPLGSGGGGEVWKAWDRDLDRWVAVKRPASLGRIDERERFQREALAAARLSHPNIVPIYRVALHEDRPYIVMPLVEGKSLGQRPPLREALEIVRTAALAVDHAHRHGVVHRDLKPGNLMRDAEGRVWIIDFGLASLGEANRAATATGNVVGTPAYMSPEQAQGGPGAREGPTDIYALGATLYELATGRPPFEGQSFAEIVHRVIHEDPVPPRRIDPRLPGDVETIIRKAMDKDPRRRYAGAGDLAEDLRRFLADEPIAARPAGRAGRAWRRARRNPLAVALGAGLAAALLAAIALWMGAASAREAALQRLREKARESLDAALEFRRVGANDRMRQYLSKLEGAYRPAAEAMPASAEPDYWMGRMHRALMEDGRALEFQERALRKDPSFAPARYERAVLLSRNYGRDRERAAESLQVLTAGPLRARTARESPLPSPAEAERARPELSRARDQILEDCAHLERALARDPAMTEAHLLAARGILACHQGQYAEAQALLRESLASNPRLEEAWETLALAVDREPAATPEAGARKWGEVERVYTEALALDRGYVLHHIRRSEARISRASDRMDRGGDPLADLASAEEDLKEALRLDPGRAEGWRTMGIVRTTRARFRGERGKDPLPDYGEAEASLTRATELDPAYGEAWVRRGFVRARRGMIRRERGEDPAEDFDRAERDVTEGLRLERADPMAWNLSGFLRTQRGLWRLSIGEDPLPEFEGAERDFTEALRLKRDYTAAWTHRGVLRGQRALYRKESNENPTTDFLYAEEDLTEALRHNPGLAQARAWRGRVRAQLASLRDERAPAAADYAAAAEDYREAVRLNPALEPELAPLLLRARQKADELKDD